MSVESARKKDVQIGDEVDDGTILAGYFEGKPIYAMPQDALLPYECNEPAYYARQLNAQKFLGHDDWHAPSIGQLNVLWENRNKGKLKGTFNETGTLSACRYWSSEKDDYGIGWTQLFSDGSQGNGPYRGEASLRCVR